MLTAVGILLLCVLIYWLAKAVVYLSAELWGWVQGLF